MVDKKDHGEDCECSSCSGNTCKGGHCCAGGHSHLVRVLIKIAILVIIFWVGVKIGEFKSYMEGRYYGGTRMMWGLNADDGSGNGYYVGPGGMMRGWTTTAPATTTTPKK